jgi:hypothetical protein
MKITILVSIVSMLVATVAAMASENVSLPNASLPTYRCESIHPELNLAPIVIAIENPQSVQMGAILIGQNAQPETLMQQDADGTPANYVRFYANIGCPPPTSGIGTDGEIITSPRVMTCMVIRLETLMLNQTMLSGSTASDAILNGENYSCTLQATANSN